MPTEENRVVVSVGTTPQSHRVNHRDFPEIRAEGETPAAAGANLINELTRALDSALTDWRRQTMTQAIADVRDFVARGG